jgi:hypothetical protein
MSLHLSPLQAALRDADDDQQQPGLTQMHLLQTHAAASNACGVGVVQRCCCRRRQLQLRTRSCVKELEAGRTSKQMHE